MTNNNKKGTYIPSIEAEELYDLSVRGLDVEVEHNGMIPYSLELLKLRSMKDLYSERKIVIKGQFEDAENGIEKPKVKYQSNALINVKFKNKIKGGKEITSNVRGYDKLISRLKAELNKYKGIKAFHEQQSEQSENTRVIDKHKKAIAANQFKIDKLSSQIEYIEKNKHDEIYREMKATDLRNHFYTHGFTYKNREYVLYKRTSSKSRNSQTLFILKELHEPMQEWSRMGLVFEEGKKYDVASLLAYESLVSSSIVDTIKIKTNNIFIIDDEFSILKGVNAIEVGNDLKAKPNTNATIKNNIWDGQALIDISLMENVGLGDKGFAQLRQHFFKCASFTTRIQLFLRTKHADMTNPESLDYDPKIPFDYDKWKLKDAYENMIPARQILLITTPSALKFMKYVEKVDDSKEQIKLKREAYDNWCKRVKVDKCVFGICKSEKPSKYGDRSKTSYQMINTLDANRYDVQQLAQFEVNFIKDLQNNDEVYKDYLKGNAELTNSYQMFAELYERNPGIVNTQIFRNYRKSIISKYRTKVKSGKLRLQSDYCTVVSNPYEMLLSVIGELKDENGEVISHTLQGNEIYTSLHNFNKNYTVVRNPHNSQNNFYKVFNKKNELIEKYFNFKNTPNITVINAIKSSILVVANGMDTDGDTLLVFSDNEFNRIIDKTLMKREYPVIINKIDSEPDPVELTNENISKIDDKLALSQRWIGEVTNAAQFLVSTMWDIQNDYNYIGDKEEDIKDIQSGISVLVVLSNVAIDYAKKVVKVDIEGALRSVRAIKAAKKPVGINTKGRLIRKTRKKPKFWTSVTSSNPKTDFFNTPMDLLIEHINGIGKAEYRSDISIMDLMRELTPDEERETYDNQQIKDIVQAVEDFDKKMGEIHAKDHLDKDEKYRAITEAYEKIGYKIGKKAIRISTMRYILKEIQGVLDKNTEKDDDSKKTVKIKKEMRGIATHLLNLIYLNDKEKFISLFQEKMVENETEIPNEDMLNCPQVA